MPFPDVRLTALAIGCLHLALQLEKPAQANAELLALVSHKDASAALGLAALSAVLQAPCCNAVKPAIDHVLERFAEDATVAVSLVQALLGASEEEKVSFPHARHSLLKLQMRSSKVAE